MAKVKGFVRLMRPVNCAMMGFAVIVGAVLANPQFSSVDWLNFLYGCATGFMLTAASMTINDYYDRAIDAINEPTRPIPSGAVSVKGALAFVVFLSAVGFGVAFLAVRSNTGREITKGIVDVKGDRAEGVKTLAVRYGERAAAVAAAVFYLSAVFLTPLPWYLGIVSFWFIPLVLVTGVGFAVSSFLLLKDYSRENARRTKKLVLLWFILGLLAFIFWAFCV